jgi:cell division protein FtsI (penicillin-binding protein 3)
MKHSIRIALCCVLLVLVQQIFAQTYQWGGKQVTKKEWDKQLNKYTTLFSKSYSETAHQTDMNMALLSKLIMEQAESGLAVLVNLSTNKVVAKSGFIKKGKDYIQDSSLFNKQIEPGSLLVPLSAAMIIDNFGITLNDSVDLEAGKTIINGRKIVDAEAHGRRNTNLKTIIAESSNVGIAKMVNNGFKTNNYQLNFEDQIKTYVGNPNYIIPVSDENINLPYQAFGYGLLLTPNQILNFYTRVAKSDPSLFKNPTTLTQVQEALVEVCENGTAKKLFHDTKFSVAGKTGSNLVLRKNGYANLQFQAAFVGYSSVQNPKYACMVIIKCKPNSPNHFGATVAGPVFKEIMEKVLNENNSMPATKPLEKIVAPDSSQILLSQNIKFYH